MFWTFNVDFRCTIFYSTWRCNGTFSVRSPNKHDHHFLRSFCFGENKCSPKHFLMNNNTKSFIPAHPVRTAIVFWYVVDRINWFSLHTAGVCKIEKFFKWVSKVMLCLLWVRSTTLSDWLKELAPLSQPIRSKTKTNRDLLARVTCICLNFWLVHLVPCSSCDWLE